MGTSKPIDSSVAFLFEVPGIEFTACGAETSYKRWPNWVAGRHVLMIPHFFNGFKARQACPGAIDAGGVINDCPANLIRSS
jgi:hypothetical protein